MMIMRKLALICVGLVLGLALAEGLLRLYMVLVPDPPTSPYVRDPHAGYRLRPSPPRDYSDEPGNHYINKLGFRDREHPVAKAPKTYRILGIGDSFIYGAVPIEENFLRVAEAKMADRLSGDSLRVEMVLMGLGGYSTENEVGLLRSLGLSLDPDLVILNFFVGNDVTGIPIRGKVFRGRLYYQGSAKPLVHLLRRSWLFLLAEKVFLTRIRVAILRGRLQGPQKTQRQARSRTIREEEAPAASLSHHAIALSYLYIQAKRLPAYLRHPDGMMRKLWREAEGYLLEFDAACRKAGVPWILHIIPAEVQVDLQVRRSVLEGLSLSEDLYDFDAPQRRLHAFAKAHGINILDPLPRLRNLHRPEARLYVLNDTHWNARGNRVAGEMLANFAME